MVSRRRVVPSVSFRLLLGCFRRRIVVVPLVRDSSFLIPNRLRGVIVVVVPRIVLKTSAVLLDLLGIRGGVVHRSRDDILLFFLVLFIPVRRLIPPTLSLSLLSLSNLSVISLSLSLLSLSLLSLSASS